MESIVLGDGHLGRAVEAAVRARGQPAPTVLGRPSDGRPRNAAALSADVVFEASGPESVAANVDDAIAAGCRRLVIATTGWDAWRAAVDGRLRESGAAAVTAPNFSLGVAAFLRIVAHATRLLDRVEGFEPYVVEWHRRGKLDRPSGTARAIAGLILDGSSTKRRLADPSSAGPPAGDELELGSIRAGASPGMHLVGFDAPGETVELRHSARDRSPFALGMLAAADWLLARPRAPGLHSFDEVVDDLLDLPQAANQSVSEGVLR